ncbi:MAG: DedA family protein [Chlamydiae bacterium]|nr:DedA family protein [Chlamydiota bacterium]MBI3277696.1 DedA family protein [Chlamydiota bacterium]
MEWIKSFVDFFIHLDLHLSVVIQHCGGWTYVILFLIVFCETGLVVTPILPGDSLLFAVGAFSAISLLNLKMVLIILIGAAVAGDTLNYWIGVWLGPRVFHQEKSRFFKKEYLVRTHEFYERYGGKAMILARFVPIVRTFAPFVAGVGKMRYGRFLTYNVIGGIAWILLLVLGGYFFGNIPLIKHNFTLVIFAIVFISILPGIIEYFRHRSRK